MNGFLKCQNRRNADSASSDCNVQLRFVPQDKQQAEREKRQQEMEMRQERISEKERQRKKEREAYLKKTKRGQPVMKHRVDKMLAKLQAELA